jgi:hypothetical protein
LLHSWHIWLKLRKYSPWPTLQMMKRQQISLAQTLENTITGIAFNLQKRQASLHLWRSLITDHIQDRRISLVAKEFWI